MEEIYKNKIKYINRMTYKVESNILILANSFTGFFNNSIRSSASIKKFLIYAKYIKLI